MLQRRRRRSHSFAGRSLGYLLPKFRARRSVVIKCSTLYAGLDDGGAHVVRTCTISNQLIATKSNCASSSNGRGTAGVPSLCKLRRS